MTTELKEPIAIIGIGCRFPGGATSTEEFWDFLCRRGNGISPVPEDRWGLDGFYDSDPTAIARSTTKWGGFLDDVRSFDAEFFGISSREANSMDPQQRIVLEIVYEALQDANLKIADAQSEKTGVFVGVSTSDYGAIQRLRKTTNDIYAGTGSALSIVSNRVSHRLNLSGPSYSVDTACSSSLVAVDQACWNLNEGTCSRAIAAGVNIIVDPAAFIAFSKAGMLSTTGTISTFDSAANGYVRGEGCGAVILKRLSDAERDGDRIYAVIRATSVNQDGRTTTLTAPNPDRQVAMLEELCRRADILPSEVHYVEAHGTGTPVGDPIEASALGRVFGLARESEPVLIGSVKPNIGHLESAAGISGLIKTALVVHHRAVPPNRNFNNPNPNIPFETLGIKVPTELTPLGDGIARAAVNSFGFGGTNASVLLESYEPAPRKAAIRPARASARSHVAVPLSAATETSLRQFAGALARQLSEGGRLAAATLGDLAASLGGDRDAFRHRAVAIAQSTDHLRSLLLEIAEDRVQEPEPRQLPHIVMGSGGNRATKLVFTFAGQGGQWWAMARQLLADEPVFRREVEAFDRVFKDLGGWSIIAELKRPEARTRVHDPEITQPGIFAVQIGLAAIWRNAGVVPDLILGHSFGEVAAAYVAGALTLESAATLIHKRGLISKHIPANGAMIAVGLSAEHARQYIDAGSSVDVAAFNGPTMVTCSGIDVDIEALEKRLTAERPDVLCRRLAMNLAWHSRALDPAEKWFRKAVGKLKHQVPAIPFISTVSGKLETKLDADYWWGNLRQPVSYESAVTNALDFGAGFFLEIGPHRTLSGLTATLAAACNKPAGIANSLIQNVDDFHAIGTAAATLYAAGIKVDFAALAGSSPARLTLPRYQWDRDQFWSDSEESRRLLNVKVVHPLLGSRDPGPQIAWETEINLQAMGYIADHTINGDVIFPAAGYMDILLAAGLDYFGKAPIELGELVVPDALFIAQDDNIILRTTFDPDSGRAHIYSHLRDSAKGWVQRASARITHPSIVAPEVPDTSGDTPLARLDREQFYALALRHSFEYGPEFQGAFDVGLIGRGVVAEIEGGPHATAHAGKHAAHPAVLDSAMQTAIPLADVGAGLPIDASADPELRYPLYLPIGADRLRLFAPLPARVKVQVTVRSDGSSDNIVDYLIADLSGAPCLLIEGFRSQRMDAEEKKASGPVKARFLHESYAKIAVPAPVEAPDATAWLLIGDERGIGETLIGKLGRAAAPVQSVILDDATSADPEKLRELILAHVPKDGKTAILVSAPLDTAKLHETSEPAAIEAAVERNVLGLLALGKALDTLRESGPHPAVWLLTSGARPLPGDEPLTVTGLAEAPLTGMMRTIAAECREYRFHHVDFAALDAVEMDHCVALMAAGTDEAEIALRGDAVYVPRVEAPEQGALPRRQIRIAPDNAEANYVASMSAPGSLDAIRLEEAELTPLGADDVRLAVKAVGLNFRDIMAATGLLPAKAEKQPGWQNLGLEYSATVVALGANVTSLAVGDRVMGMGRRCLQAYINQPAAVLSKLPERLSLPDAATIPSAFATAHYALNHVGRLAPGEKVLIHVATGGVGIAAIQLAKRAGAEIFATAGSDAKRAYLRDLGIEHVMNSRSLDFADQIMEITGGRGVDMILNSLPGDFITRGLDVLAPYGRFLEIGKRDIYMDSLVGLKALRKNISLNVIDLAAMGDDRPELLARLATQVMEMFENGELTPLPSSVFPITEVSEAFRFMSQARHIGKVVVSFPDETVSVLSAEDKPTHFRADRSYLVTGGSRGFGITVADWLSAGGAGRVLLASRSGKADPDQQAAVAAIAARGTEVVDLALDITDTQAVRDAVRAHATGDKPLAGIVHGAAVIKDGFLAQLDTETVLAVLRPKTLGAWNLHTALREAGLDLDFFVSFSSLAQVIGSIGQANYVAANAFLDAFAFYRQGQGQSGQTIDWGSLGESGFVARSDSMTNYLESMGMVAVTNAEATGALDSLLRLEVPSVAFASVDWSRIARAAGEANMPPRLRGMLDVGAASGGRIRSDVLAAPRGQWVAMLTAFMVEQVAKVLKVEESVVDAERALTELGFDSLSSIELKNRVEGQLGISIPVSAFLQTPTLAKLGETIAVTLDEEARQRAAAGNKDAGEGRHGGQDKADVHATDEQKLLLAASTGPLATDQGRLNLEHRIRFAVNQPAVDDKTIRRAFADLGKRHVSLSLALARTPGADIEASYGKAPAAQKVEDVAAALAAPLSVNDGELARMVWSGGDKRIEIGLAVHGAVSDAAGFRQLARDLVALLDGAKLGKRPSAPAARAASAADAARAHWEAVVHPAVDPVALPSRQRALSLARFGANRGEPGEYAFEIAWEGSAETAETALLGAFAAALAETTGRTEIVVEALDAAVADRPEGFVGAIEQRFPVVIRNIGGGTGPSPLGQIERQLRASRRHAGLGTAFVETMLGAEDGAALALRQFGFGFASGSASLARELKAMTVAGQPVRVLAEDAAAGGLHDIALFARAKRRSTYEMMLSFDRDVFGNIQVAKLAKLIAKRLPQDEAAPARARKPAVKATPAKVAAPKPAAATRQLNGAGRSKTVSTAPGAVASSSKVAGAVFPVTPNQNWILNALASPDCTKAMRQGLMIPQGLIVKPRLDVARLRRAVAALTEAHESLRTRFERNGTAWRAVVEPRHRTGLVVEDVARISDRDLVAKVNRIIDEEYDVGEGPLFDVRLLRLGAKGDAILMRVHHAVVDGWAVIKLIEDLFGAYLGSTISFDPKLSTAALIREMDAQKNSPAAERARRHWRSAVEPWLETPKFGRVAKGLPLNPGGALALPREAIVARVSGDALAQLNRAAASAKVTTNALLMAAFSKALAGAGGVDGVYIGSRYPRRAHDSLAQYIGFLAADIPLRATRLNELSMPRIAADLYRQASRGYDAVDLNFLVDDLFAGAPVSGPRAVFGGLLPERMARNSPFEALMSSGPGHSLRFGAMEVQTLPIAPRNALDQEISLRPMAMKDEMTLRLSYEVPAFTRAEANIILDEILASLKLREGDKQRGIESFGDSEAWSADFDDGEAYRIAGE